MKKKKWFLLLFVLSWFVVTAIWHNSIIAVFQGTEKIAEEPIMMMERRIEADQFNVEDAPVKDSVSNSDDLFNTIKIVVSGLIGLANLLGGSILLWQKILGKR